jgi:hypothetical protein
MTHNSNYPRPLTPREKEWLEWILPPGRKGYTMYRTLIEDMVVIGAGRRGAGEVIFGLHGDSPDFDAPLSPVFAYGLIETNFGPISITLREVLGNQISVEIVSHRMEQVPTDFEETRRWTYSTWKPNEPCPQCLTKVREVSMHTNEGKQLVLAVCAYDKRLWIYEQDTEINHLIPVTNFYNELMLHKNIRDPKIALDSKRLFTELEKYSDADLTYGFLTYNKLRTKVRVEGKIEAGHSLKKSLLKRLTSILQQ